MTEQQAKRTQEKSLADQLREAVAWIDRDEDRQHEADMDNLRDKRGPEYTTPYVLGHSRGSYYENKRLYPILEKLICCADALEDQPCDCLEANHVSGLMKHEICWRCSALTELRAELERVSK